MCSNHLPNLQFYFHFLWSMLLLIKWIQFKKKLSVVSYLVLCQTFWVYKAYLFPISTSFVHSPLLTLNCCKTLTLPIFKQLWNLNMCLIYTAQWPNNTSKSVNSVIREKKQVPKVTPCKSKFGNLTLLPTILI